MKKVRDKGERVSLRREVGELRKELRSREASAIGQILKNAQVVLSTNTGQCGLGGGGASRRQQAGEPITGRLVLRPQAPATTAPSSTCRPTTSTGW